MVFVRSQLLGLGLFLTLTFLFLLATAEFEPKDPEGRAEPDNSYMDSADYIGSTMCGACHQSEYDRWQQTHHTMKVRPINESIVLADFTQEVVSSYDIELFHPVDSDDYYVNLAGHNYTVDWVLGSGAWKQQFMVNLENSTYVLPLQWNRETATWVLNRPANWFDAQGDPLQMDWGFGGLQPTFLNRSWEKDCAGCHLTGYTPRQNQNGEWVAILGDNLAEYNVGCEACHGPGSEHVAASSPEQRRANIWLTNEADICAQCHVRGTSLDGQHAYPVNMLPGDGLADHFRLDTLMWDDGVTSKSNYQEYADWLRSGHNQVPSVGVKRAAPCVNCHTPEGAKALFEGEPLTEVPAEAVWQITCEACHDAHGTRHRFNLRADIEQLCITCHNSAGSEPPNLAHHGMYEMLTGQGGLGIIGDLRMGGAVTCTDCHMPHVAESAVEWDIASHTFKTIEPGYSIANHMPNSCTTDCHNQQGPGSYLTPASADRVVRAWHAGIEGLMSSVSTNLTLLETRLEEARQAGRQDTYYQQAMDLFEVADYNFELVAHEGSRGVHNFEYARALLFDSGQKVEEAGELLAREPPSNLPVLILGDTLVAAPGQELLLEPEVAYDPEGTQLTYAWVLDDGTLASSASLTHNFTNLGRHRVTLTVTDGEGLAATDSQLIYVLDLSNRSEQLDDLEDKTATLEDRAQENADTLADKVGYLGFFAGLLLALLAVGAVYMYFQEELEVLRTETGQLEAASERDLEGSEAPRSETEMIEPDNTDEEQESRCGEIQEK